MEGNEHRSKNIPSHKFHGKKTKTRSKNKSIKETKIDIEKDDRFADFTKPEKKPPVDMFGRPVSPDALENYQSSSDDEPEMLIPSDVLPSDDEEPNYSNKINRRMAVVNQPWKDIKAQDIFQYFYLNMGDNKDDLLSVKVFLSQYGQEHPQKEAPPPTDNEEFEIALWRKRNKDDLKRYFAVCEFRDAKSADNLYEALKNVGISDDEGSFFDLQFLNDETWKEVSSFPVRDEAHEYVKDWNPPEVYDQFLTSTKNNDTWDSAPPERVNSIKNIWKAIEDDLEAEITEPTIFGSGSEEDEKLSRNDVKFLFEEEDQYESESEENADLKVDFVQEENEASEKNDENQVKNKKNKKKSKETTNINEIKTENEEDTIKSVMEDDRFKDLFALPGYGIDTSDPNFKRTELMDKFMNEVTKKHMEANSVSDKEKSKGEASSGIESTVERLRRRSAMRANKK